MHKPGYGHEFIRGVRVGKFGQFQLASGAFLAKPTRRMLSSIGSARISMESNVQKTRHLVECELFPIIYSDITFACRLPATYAKVNMGAVWLLT